MEVNETHYEKLPFEEQSQKENLQVLVYTIECTKSENTKDLAGWSSNNPTVRNSGKPYFCPHKPW